MKKKLIVLGICLFSILCFIGCGKPESQVAFEKEIALIKNPPKEELKNMSAEEKQIMKAIYEKMTYKINKVEENGDTAKINATFHILNFPAYIGEYMQIILPMAFTNPSEEELEKASQKFFGDLMKRKDLKYIDETVDIYMKKVDGEWDTDESKMFMSIFSGNLENFFKFN